MKSRLNSRLFIAGALLIGIVPMVLAQSDQANSFASVRRMEAVAHQELIPTGRVGQQFRKSAQRFEAALTPALVNKGPGRIGQPERKAAQPFDGNTASIVDVGSEAAFLDLTDAKTTIQRSAVTAEARTLKPEAASIYDPRAALTSPANGSTLNPVQLFTWSPGYQPQDYYIWVGSCQDCNDILSQDMGLNLSASVSLPTDGRVIYLSLFTYYGGYWYWFDYQFYASSGGAPASMTSPTNGSTLAGSQTFTWSAGYQVDEYYLWIGSCQDCTDILNQSQGHNLSRTVSMPNDGRVIFVTLFSSIGGNWYWFDYQYRAPSATVYKPHIVVTNKLDYDLHIMANGVYVGTVTAGLTQYADPSVVSPLTVSFQLVQPVLSGRTLGDPMAGVFSAIANPSGTYNFTVNYATISGQPYFRPLITNRTPVPLYVEVNGGLQAENRCNCYASSGSTNVATGYYKLYSNGNVRLMLYSTYAGPYWFWGTDGNGVVASGGTLPGYVQADTGRAFFTATQVP